MDYRSDHARVAIPRLERRNNDYRAGLTRGIHKRVTKACNDCRNRKVRCSGEMPQCQNCINQALVCTYPQTRKDRLKNATDHIEQLVELLKVLSVQVDENSQQQIGELLASMGETSLTIPTRSDTSKQSPTERKASVGESVDADSEAEVTGSITSDELHSVDENLFHDRESRATGFIGQNSAVQWLHTVRNETRGPERMDFTHQFNNTSEGQLGEAADVPSSSPGYTFRVSNSTFYLDCDEYDMNEPINSWELPDPEVAELLVDCYMETVHPSFPILPETFDHAFRRYCHSAKTGQQYRLADDWQATLNLVLAIGAQYLRLSQSRLRVGEHDQVLYMKRAMGLMGLDKLITCLPGPSLREIQATGLLSLYFLTVGQVNRAWTIVGVAIRFSLAIGLHLRNDGSSTTSESKEAMSRVWWSLDSLENLLCTMTGRPYVINRDQCTAPIPRVFPKAFIRRDSTSHPPSSHWVSQPLTTVNRGTNSGGNVSQLSFQENMVAAAAIIEKALSGLYSPQVAGNSWQQIHTKILALSNDLEKWAVVALSNNFHPSSSANDLHVQREQLLLKFQYYSAKLLIFRPCLSRLDQRGTGDSNASAEFNRKGSIECIQGAHAFTSLFPDHLDLTFIFQRTPWWCIVHNIMQALAVFLLGRSFWDSEVEFKDETSQASIKKLLSWLEHMSVGNAVAKRAHDMVIEIINTGCSRLQFHIADISTSRTTDQQSSFSLDEWADDWARNIEEPSSSGTTRLTETQHANADPSASTANLSSQDPIDLWKLPYPQEIPGFSSGQYSMSDLDAAALPAFDTSFMAHFNLSKPLENWDLRDENMGRKGG